MTVASRMRFGVVVIDGRRAGVRCPASVGH